jgi:hypothetical protein
VFSSFYEEESVQGQLKGRYIALDLDPASAVADCPDDEGPLVQLSPLLYDQRGFSFAPRLDVFALLFRCPEGVLVDYEISRDDDGFQVDQSGILIPKD